MLIEAANVVTCNMMLAAFSLHLCSTYAVLVGMALTVTVAAKA
jgi:hypothetical protein